MVDSLPRQLKFSQLSAEFSQPAEDLRQLTVLQELEAATRFFSGPIFILLPAHYRNPKTPQLHIDLARIGFMPGSTFTVRDHQKRLLYQDSHRYFGETLREQRLVAAAPHGSCLYVQYFNGHRAGQVLIWICKRHDHPQLTQSLHYKKFLRDTLLNRVVAPDWQPLAKARDRAVQLAQLNQVREISGEIASRSQSQVTMVPETIVQGTIAVSPAPTAAARSQVVATAHPIILGAIAAKSSSRSYGYGKAERLIIGQLHIQSPRSHRSRLEAHLRVRPQTPAGEAQWIYGAFGNALLKHRRRYGFSYDPDLNLE